MLVAYWVSRYTIHRTTIPLRVLAKSADEVAQGNFHAPLPEPKHNDEISQLRDSFSNMQQSLTQYIDQLKTTTAQKAAMESELSIARDIQLSMVPTVFPELDNIDIFASMTPAKAVGILDLTSGLLRYCNAGHEAPLIIKKTVEPLPVNEIYPVGLLMDAPYETQEIVIEPETTILLYTDGLDEAMNADKKQFGEKRIFEELNRAIQTKQLSPQTVIEQMIQAVHDYVGDTEQSDDLTLLCLRRV